MKSIRKLWSPAHRLSLLIAIAFVLSFAFRASATRKLSLDPTTSESSAHAPSNQLVIPPGTILPIRIGSLSSEKSKPGELIKARIMQDVPLGSGEKLRAGSKVLGHIIAVSPATLATQAALTIKFDTVLEGNEQIPVVTHLRAFASTLEVEFAQVPPIGPGETDVYDWLTTIQVGGEVVYGKGGEVYNGGRVVGRSVYDGVLAQVNAQPGTKCQGPVEGNDRPQAFWVFSSDACGTYGFPYLTIAHAGRTDPQGEIVLVSLTGPIKIRSGSGMLLRVQTSAYNAAQSGALPASPSLR